VSYYKAGPIALRVWFYQTVDRYGPIICGRMGYGVGGGRQRVSIGIVGEVSPKKKYTIFGKNEGL